MTNDDDGDAQLPICDFLRDVIFLFSSSFRFHMSMMEIYNEAVYDLLRTESKDSRQSASPGGGTKTSLDIRQNATGGTSVPGLTEVDFYP